MATENQDMQQIVKPVVKAQDAVSDLKSFEDLKKRLLADSDYQVISGKNFIKKSGWRKLALVFNISDEIIESSRRAREDEDSFVWTFRVRASAPNGRYTEAVAACDSRERRFSHVEHDTFATAHTRAKSRAISDLIGAGEISAEEIDYDRSSESALNAEPTEEEKERAKSLLSSANDIMSHVRQAKPKARAPIKTSDAEEEHLATSRFDLTLDGQVFPVAEEEPPFSTFFLGKICKSIGESNPSVGLEMERSHDGKITSVVFHNITASQQKEIANTLTWSVRKVAEKRLSPEKQAQKAPNQ